MELSVQNGLQVDGQEFMSISLLADAIARPDCGQRLDYWVGIGLFFGAQISNESRILGLVALVRFCVALLVLIAHTEGMERDCVGQTLHYRIEEACIAEIVHWISDSLWQF